MLKLVLAILFFLVSLLTILPAPAYFLWLIAIIVDEFAWIFICLTLIVFFAFINAKSYPAISNPLIILAFILFITPIIRSYIVSASLCKNMTEAFGPVSGVDQTMSPFGITRIFDGNEPIAPTSFTYKTDGKLQCQLDFYASELKGIRPCVIVVHGGSWKSGDNKQLPELNSILAKKGYHVAAITYRMAPEYQCPAPVEDIDDAVKFLKSKSLPMRIDTNKLVLLGRSAGAQISLLAAYTRKDDAIKGVIDFYGPADMVWGYSIPSNPLIMNSRKVMEDYLGGTYQEHPKNFENASPLLFVSRKSPPTLLIHGKNDVLVAYEHSRRLNKKLDENQVPHYLLTLPWATHGFDYNVNGPGGQLSTYAVLYFLSKVTNQ